MESRLIVSGFGGQGVMLLGQFLAYAGMLDGRQVSWIPCYGPEMRGGTAYCSVVISDRPIASPLVPRPDLLIAMNTPSLERFLPAVRPGGTVLFNSSLVEKMPEPGRRLRLIPVPAHEMAEELGNVRTANMIILGCYLEARGGLSGEAVEGALRKAFIDAVGRPELLQLNREAIARGRALLSGGK